ncbi:MAG TPA: TIGR03086 family metal-binding protein [Trebonia sp.]
MHLDLTPATETLARVVTDIGDDQLGAPTPCHGMTVADVLDHVDGLCLAFTAAAAKDRDAGRQAPVPDGSRLGTDWRARIPGRLAHLAAAWRDDSAWAGMTRAGGIDMPGEIAGTVAIDEVVVHGWDVAVATGRDYSCDEGLLQAAYGFAQAVVARDPHGTPGLFGPPVTVPDDAPLLDRLLGLTGRDPAWRPDSQS